MNQVKSNGCEVSTTQFLRSVTPETLVATPDLPACPADCEGMIENIVERRVPILGLKYTVVQLVCPISGVKFTEGLIASTLIRHTRLSD